MTNDEVERLRRLRGTALRARAVASALDGVGSGRREPYAVRSQHAAWRIARSISGYLRAHPYEEFQKDAPVGILLANRLVALGAAIAARTPERARARLQAVLKRLARELDDARAVTWSRELSESFGRSQLEIRALLLQLQPRANETSVSQPVAEAPLAVEGVVAGDWPYLAI
jgi:hypothetical protein